MTDYAKIRTNMVDCQLRTNKVSAPALLDAFLAVPREIFVPEAARGVAYVDNDLPLGQGRFLIEPMVLGRLLQAAEIKPGDAVLDLGCAAGYASAILARLAQSIVAVEADPALLAQAKANLAGQRNVAVYGGPLDRGWPDWAPYDVILIAGTVSEIPAAVVDQLAEGGRLVTIFETRPGQLGEATLLQRSPGGVNRRRLFESGVHPLPGFGRQPSFAFEG